MFEKKLKFERIECHRQWHLDKCRSIRPNFVAKAAN